MDASDRYSRQRRLPEVGDAGQERLERAALVIAAGPAAAWELSYLERAGARELAISRWHRPEAFAHQAYFRHASSRQLGAGSWRALRKINLILEAR